MEALNFIKKTHKEAIGFDIDNNLYDEEGHNYEYYSVRYSEDFIKNYNELITSDLKDLNNLAFDDKSVKFIKGFDNINSIKIYSDQEVVIPNIRVNTYNIICCKNAIFNDELYKFIELRTVYNNNKTFPNSPVKRLVLYSDNNNNEININYDLEKLKIEGNFKCLNLSNKHNLKFLTLKNLSLKEQLNFNDIKFEKLHLTKVTNTSKLSFDFTKLNELKLKDTKFKQNINIISLKHLILKSINNIKKIHDMQLQQFKLLSSTIININDLIVDVFDCFNSSVNTIQNFRVNKIITIENNTNEIDKLLLDSIDIGDEFETLYIFSKDDDFDFNIVPLKFNNDKIKIIYNGMEINLNDKQQKENNNNDEDEDDENDEDEE